MELRLINHTRLLRWQSLVPANVLNDLARAEVPELELSIGLVRAGQEVAVVDVNGITANVRLEYGANWAARRTDVPDHDCVVPAAGDDVVRVVGVEFAAEDSVAMTWSA